MKKHIFSCLLMICLNHVLVAQKTIRIVDGETGKPVSEPVATWPGGQIVGDNEGMLKMPDGVASLTISRTGYFSLVLNPSEFSGNVLPLKPDNQLAEVSVTAYPYARKPLTVPASYTKISGSRLEIANQLDYGNVLNTVPGVFMHTGTLGTNRITIRGIGARTPFGTNKIRAYFGEIPLTAGDGETSLEDNDLSAIGSIEVIKGPSATAYGAGLAGLIKLKPTTFRNRQFKTIKYAGNTDYSGMEIQKGRVSSSYGIGSFGLSKTRQSLQLASEKHAFQAVFSTIFQDGFRENSQYNRENLLVNYQYKGESIRLDFLSTLTDVKGFIPSSLNATDFAESPSAAAGNWAAVQGFEEYTKGLAGFTLTTLIDDKQSLSGTLFTTFRENYELRPFGFLTEQSVLYGSRWKYTNEISSELTLVAGGELSVENYESTTLRQEDRQPGDLTSFNDQKRRTYNIFAETSWAPTDHWTVTGGINFSQLQYELRDLFRSNGDQSGDYAFDPVLSPRLLIGYRLKPSLFIYGQLSHGFSAPSVEETLTPDGQLNPDIQPEKGISFEIGSKGHFLHQKLHYSLNAYSMNVRNLLVARRTAEDQFIGINAGRTSHQGLEATLDYQITQKHITWSPFLNFTVSSIRFDEFVDNEDDFSGNDLPGVPSYQVQAGIEASMKNGLQAVVNYRAVGEMYLRDDNVLKTDSYGLLNLRIAYQKQIKKVGLHLDFGVNNLLDETYAAQVLINAGSFGGNAPRYFYPGNPRNFYGNIRVSYLF
ncbi:MAG: TonB-dependent receptor [Bacteroidota bacterium]